MEGRVAVVGSGGLRRAARATAATLQVSCGKGPGSGSAAAAARLRRLMKTVWLGAARTSGPQPHAYWIP
jgi:hypothetical protein